jgi:Mn-dependent DtxR family transcriptional regulator
MADIKDVLTDVLKTMDSVDGLKKSLEDLGKLKVDAGVDLKSIRNVEKLQTAVKSLAKAREALAKAEQEEMEIRKAGNELSEEQKEKYDEAEAAVKKYEKAVVNSAISQKNAIDSLTKKAEEEKELIMERFKQNTILGKSYNLLTGKVAQFAAGITAGTLALKAIGRFTDAARLRNDMMIASYRKLDDSFSEALSGTLDYEAAMRKAETAAISMGMANENVSDIMIRYQRVVGNATPEALGALTEATLAMAKVMGITGAQAIDYVQARMDNFGGTAADALSSLDEMREGMVKLNNGLFNVNIRGDDVVRTIQDITNSSGVYAVDQRFLSQILMRTSATLQAQGESYTYAQKMAENYTKALSSDAPEWMQITNSFDITKEVEANTETIINEKGEQVKALTTDFAARLDAAKPGLSKKVQDLLNAGYSQYDVTRLLGETLKDTEIGMTSMSKKIVELGKSSISTLASVYGKSYMEAEEMYKSAVKTQEMEKMTAKFKSANVVEQQAANEEIKKYLKVSDEVIQNSKTDKALQDTLIKQYAEAKSLEEARTAESATRLAAQKQYDAILGKIEKTEQSLAIARVNGKEGDIKYYEDALKGLQEEKNRAYAQITNEKTGDSSILGALTKKVQDFQKATSMLTGDWFKAKFNEYSGPIQLATGALGMLLMRGLGVKLTGIQKVLDNKIYGVLVKIANKSSGGGSDDDGFGGGSRGRRRRNKSLKNTKMGRGAGGGLFKRAAGATKGLFGRSGGFLKGGLKGVGKLGKGLLKKVPGLGLGFAALDAGDAFASGGAKGATKSLIGSGGGAVGSVVGGALGSIVPGLGTIIGATVGGFVGDALGGVAADMYDKFTSNPEEIKTKLTPQNQVNINAAMAQKGQQSGDQQAAAMSGMTGDLGKLNPDGSVTLTINNFMETYVQAMGMAKQSGIKP